jgi:hypothetical protein
MTIVLGLAGCLLLGVLIGGRATDPAGWIGSVPGAVLLPWLCRRFAAATV